MNQPTAKPGVSHHAPYESTDPYLNDAPLWMGVSRGIAGFFGVLCILEGFRALLIGQQTADFGWLDLSPCPPDLARGLIAFSGVCLLLFGLTHRLPAMVRMIAIIGTMIVFAVATGNAVSVHRSIQLGELQDGIPMSAHVVTLLVPVLFGLVRGSNYGPLRFPLGGSMLVLSLVLTGGAFSIGYLTSLSKFHRPQANGLIVIMPHRSDAAETPSPNAEAVQRLIRNGYGNEVVLLHEPDSPVSAATADALKRTLPSGTQIRTAAVTSDADIASAIANQRSVACQFVGDRRDSARMRLIAQAVTGRVSFVVATTTQLGRNVSKDIEGLWRTWISGFSNRATGPVQSTVTMGSGNQAHLHPRSYPDH